MSLTGKYIEEEYIENLINYKYSGGDNRRRDSEPQP